MTQPDPAASPAHSRAAIIADLACVVAEISDLQVEQAKAQMQQARIGERTAILQSRLGRMIRDLSSSTAVLRAPAGPTPPEPARTPAKPASAPEADTSQIAEKLASAGERVDDLIEEARDLGKRIAAAVETPADAGGGASGAKLPKRTFPQPLPADDPRRPALPSADEPRVPRREPEVRTAGGGLVQDGGGLSKPAVPSKREQVLDLYAAEAPTNRDIAARTGAPEGSVGGWISLARKAGDARVKAGDERRAALTAPAAKPAPSQSAMDAKQLPLPVAPAAPPAAAPARTAPVAPRPAVVSMRIPDGMLIAVKVMDGEVHGPGGVWKTSPETAKAFGFISDGKLYGLPVMARHGGLDPKVCEGLVGMWSAALAKIGIHLKHVKGAGLMLQPIGASA